MNAQQQLLEYAAKHNTDGNTSNQAWLGQAIKEGIVIDRTPASITHVKIERHGNEIIVTEVVKTEHNDIVDGRVVARSTETETVVLTVTI